MYVSLSVTGVRLVVLHPHDVSTTGYDVRSIIDEDVTNDTLRPSLSSYVHEIIVPIADS